MKILLLGNGARGYEDEYIKKAEKLGMGIMTSWRAMDFIDHDHPLYKGRPGGISTNECMDLLLDCEKLICVGCRLDLAMVGYDYEGFAPKADIVICDIDEAEREKLPFDFREYRMTAEEFLKWL